MRKILLHAAILTLLAGNAWASSMAPDYITRLIPAAAPVGQGSATYMTMSVYDAVLYAPHGEWQEGKPMALSLTYLTNLDGKKIAARSVDEMRKQGFTDEDRLAAWDKQMTAIFPDVEKGTNLTGLYTQGGETQFFRDGKYLATIQDKDFGPRFFDIWLSQKSSEPGLRAELLP